MQVLHKRIKQSTKLVFRESMYNARTLPKRNCLKTMSVFDEKSINLLIQVYVSVLFTNMHDFMNRNAATTYEQTYNYNAQLARG